MNSVSKHLSPEFLYQQNLSFLKSLFPGRLAVTNEEFAIVIGKSAFAASCNRKAGDWPVTMGKKRAGKILLTEAARWLLSYMQISPTPQNTAQEQNPAPISTTPLDIPIQKSEPNLTDIPIPRTPARTGRRGRPRGSRNRAKENLVWDPAYFKM